MGIGVEARQAPCAGDSDTLAFPESNFDSGGLSVRGGDVRPCINGADDEIVGCAAKNAANLVGSGGEVIARDAG